MKSMKLILQDEKNLDKLMRCVQEQNRDVVTRGLNAALPAESLNNHTISRT